ncbi:hypothetical protein I7I50_04829 [Histoplasma capsulatum G186AR]|uniref:Aminoglycoside phosphotransferase domain-containing protein n=1 Tax=Ajellomyces capsulatus TaxID=5037 RepID=A0A8H8D8H6_AJECA|nr:hypothetical protein I7I52_03092 [Histoplasma capsulatum]QSS75637.1 hypothetical protein I7I50_04829 [Histoplasma capsulatum G186AR]
MAHRFSIAGLLDWEYSGFYPEYHELIKSSNGLSTSAEDDWYLFLPECISPEFYGVWWLPDYAQKALVELSSFGFGREWRNFKLTLDCNED